MGTLAPAAEALAPQSALRWSGVAAVVAIHLLLLLMLWQNERQRPRPAESPAMTLLPVTRPTAPAAPPRSLPSFSQVPSGITLPVPRFDLAPPPPRPTDNGAITLPASRGFDLSIHKDGPASLEQLFPDAEARRKQFLREQDRANDLANEKDPPISSDDCVATTSSSRDAAAPSNIGAGFGNSPELACTPHLSLKALKRRNDLLSPH